MTSVLVKGGHGGRIDARQGELLEIVNVEGKQVCDFFAFNRDNLREHLSPGHTRSVLRRVVIRPRDKFYTVIRNPMFELVEDTCGVNDFCMPQCDPQRYAMDFDAPGHRSCRMNLVEATKGLDLVYEYLPEPFNFFQSTKVLADGTIESYTSPAKPGDRVVLRCLMDVIAVASACPQDISPLNDRHLTDIEIRVRPA